MPIDTDLQILRVPAIEIVIEDTGGGGGSKRVLDLFVCFNPNKLAYQGPASRQVRRGVLLWHRKRFPKNKGRVRFNLSRKKKGKAFVVLAAVNPLTGEVGKPRTLEYP